MCNFTKIPSSSAVPKRWSGGDVEPQNNLVGVAYTHTHTHAGTIFFKKLKKQGVCLIRAIKAIFPQKGTDSGFREGGLISVESV